LIFGRAVITSGELAESPNPDISLSLFAKTFTPLLDTNSTLNFSEFAFTDQNGEFRCVPRGYGEYTLYIKDGHTGKSAFIDKIILFAGILDTLYDSLTYPGSISGNIYLLDSLTKDTSAAVGWHVFIAATPFKTVTGTDGTFKLDTIPEGIYSLSVAAPSFDPYTKYTIAPIYEISDQRGSPFLIRAGAALESRDIYIKR
jgi:hypothetical protein